MVGKNVHGAFLRMQYNMVVTMETWCMCGGSGLAAQLAKTGYHTRLIHFVQYFLEESVCMVSEGHVEPVDE